MKLNKKEKEFIGDFKKQFGKKNHDDLIKVDFRNKWICKILHRSFIKRVYDGPADWVTPALVYNYTCTKCNHEWSKVE